MVCFDPFAAKALMFGIIMTAFIIGGGVGMFIKQEVVRRVKHD